MFQSFVNFISSVAVALVAVFGINLGTKEPRYDIEDRIGGDVEYVTIQRALSPRRLLMWVNPTMRGAKPLCGSLGIFRANQSRQK